MSNLYVFTRRPGLRSRRRRSIVSLLLVAACASVATPAAVHAQSTAPATTPAASRPAVRTNIDHLRDLAAFDTKFGLEVYLAKGHRDPKWDADAQELIHQAILSIYANPKDNQGFVVAPDMAEPMSRKDQIALAERVIDSGCDDMLVLYMATRTLFANGERVENSEHYRTARDRGHAAIASAPYLPIYKLQSEMTYSWDEMVTEESPAGQAKLERIRAVVTDLLCDKQTLPAYREVVWTRARMLLDDQSPKRIETLLGALGDLSGKADPWVWNVFMANAELQRAWAARGRRDNRDLGVTPAQEAAYREHLDQVDAYATAAIDVDDSFPHPYALLITAAKGLNSDQLNDMFRQATQRQFDYIPAYTALRATMRGRLGSNAAAQLRFAAQCAAVDRFDTGVPAVALEVLNDLQDDLLRPFKEDEVRGLRGLVHRVCDGYLDLPSQPKLAGVRRWALSVKVAWHVRLGEFDAARNLLDDMPGFTYGAGYSLGMEAAQIVGQVYAMTGPQAAQVKAALETADPHARRAAFEAILPLMSQPDGEPKTIERSHADAAYAWVRQRGTEAAFDEELAKGDWTPVRLDPKRADYLFEPREWTVRDGGLEIDNAGIPTSCVLPVQLPDRFEMRCRIKCTSRAPMPPLFIVVPFRPYRVIETKVDPSDSKATTYSAGTYYMRATLPKPDAQGYIPFNIRYDQGFTFLLDPAGKILERTQFLDQPVRRIAFRTNWLGSGTWRIVDIQVRKL